MVVCVFFEKVGTELSATVASLWATLLLHQLWNELLVPACLARVVLWMKVTEFLKFSTDFNVESWMFLIWAYAYMHYIHLQDSICILHLSLYLLHILLQNRTRTTTFYMLQIWNHINILHRNFFFFVFISFLMENDPPPHLKTWKKKIDYCDIIQTTLEMNLIFCHKQMPCVNWSRLIL